MEPQFKDLIFGLGFFGLSPASEDSETFQSAGNACKQKFVNEGLMIPGCKSAFIGDRDRSHDSCQFVAVPSQPPHQNCPHGGPALRPFG